MDLGEKGGPGRQRGNCGQDGKKITNFENVSHACSGSLQVSGIPYASYPI